VKVELIGTVIEKTDLLSVGTNKPMAKCGLVVREDSGSEKPNELQVEALREMARTVHGSIKRGDRVRLTCYVNGREWNGRRYVSLNVSECHVDVGRPADERADDALTDVDTGMPF
jgi:hypothetical protein